MDIVGKVLGWIAVAASVLVYQQKSRSKLLICKAIADMLWIGHYLLIGAYTGAAITGIAVVRGLVFLKIDPRSKGGKVALICFLCTSIVSSLLTWSGIFSAFAMVASMTAIVSFWIGDPKLSRILVFPISGCMLVYGLSNGSVAALVNEFFVISSAAIALLRGRKQKV